MHYFVLSLVFVLIACGAEQESETSNQAENLSNFYQSYAADLCSLNERCHLGLFPTDQARCLRILIAGIPDVAKHQLNVAAGNRCLNKLHGMSCEDFEKEAYADYGVLRTDCVFAIAGYKQLDESCGESNDCAPGLFCEGLGETSYYCGFCSHRGDRCADGSRCPSGQYCDSLGACNALASENQPCTSEEACQGGLFCVSGTCIRGAGLGQPCGNSEASACEDGLFCEPSDNGNALCKSLDFGRLAGEPCGLFSHCANDFQCENGPNGELEGFCVARIPDGQSCQGPYECLLGSWCNQGTCSRSQPDHSTCTDPLACESRLCLDGLCSQNPPPQACTPPPFDPRLPDP
jgi:hypothetical protein